MSLSFLFISSTDFAFTSSVAMSFEQRDTLRHDMESQMDGDGDFNMDPLPPGEEGMFNSHEGGEAQIYNEILSETRKCVLTIFS